MKTTVIIAIIIASVVCAVILISMLSEPTPVDNKTGQPNTIQLFVDENRTDANNLKKIHFADIFVDVNGELSPMILGDTTTLEGNLLKKALDEINAKETLSLTVEPELGLLQVMEVPKGDPRYVNAVREYLESYFSTNLVEKSDKCDIGVARVPESELKDYACAKIKDCAWLPLGGMFESQYACCPFPPDGSAGKMPSRCNVLVD